MKINEPVEVEQIAERDARGRWLTRPAGSRVITSDEARDMVRIREEKRIRLYNIGAQRVVQDARLIKEFGEDAHIVERGMTLQTIASTPDAGKAAVMAADKLDVNQGLIVKGQPEAPAQNINNILALTSDAARIIADAMSRIRAIPNQIHETIEGETVE
jgi:hypothetical protein